MHLQNDLPFVLASIFSRNYAKIDNNIYNICMIFFHSEVTHM